MKRRWLARVIHSVFFKLLLVIIITGVCINLAVGGFFMYLSMGSMQNMPFRKNVVQYLTYLVHDIGNPADMQRAKALAQSLSINIGYEGPGGAWETSADLPAVNTMELKQISENPAAYLGRHEGRRFLVVEDGGSRYIFDIMKSYSRQHFIEAKIAFLIALLTVILLCGYGVIRWLLKPIMWLNDGVQQVGTGNLDYRLPVKRYDELGTLAEAFNAMTGRIKDMLHAREQLLLDVSHELRSPITRMKVALEFIPASPVTNNMHDDLHDMQAMISEILDTQRLRSEHGRLNLQPTDPGRLVEEVVAACGHRPPGVRVENNAPGTTISLDEPRMRTVLTNLVDNALKYSAGTNAPVRITLLQEDGHAVIRIRDSGRGIPAEDLPHVFEPFYRVDKSRSKHTGGYGLGLSICKTIVDAHKGSIQIDSAVGHGTTVSVLLPAV